MCLTPKTQHLRPLQCGGACSGSGGLDGGAVPLSSLKIPASLPKKPFFLLGSCCDASCPFAGCGFGGSTFSPPNKREKNPRTPACSSQVSRGSVPATKAVT